MENNREKLRTAASWIINGDDKVRCTMTILIGEDNIAHLFMDVAIDLNQIDNESELADICKRIREAIE